MAQGEIALRGGKIGGSRFENLAIRFALRFQRGQAVPGLRQLRFGGSSAYQRLGAALFIVAAARVGTVNLQRNLADAVAILAQFSLDRIAALRALVVLRFIMLDLFRPMLHFLGQDVELGVNFRALVLDLGELAGQHQSQLGAHLVAQAGVAFGLGSLALERVHLPRDFLENVVHAVQIQLGIFQARFRQPLLGFEFRDAGRFFENRAAIGGTAAQDLANASLLDESVGFGAQSCAHEEFLNIAQAAESAVEQVFAVARAEQPPRDHNFSRMELLLIELAAANFQNDVRSGCAD